MPTVNGPDEITSLEGGNDKVFYSNNSGEITELSLGASGTVLTSAGATSAPTWEVLNAGGSIYETTTGDAVAIALGDVVNLKSDGTVVKIQTTYSAGMAIGSNSSSVSAYNTYMSFMSHDAIEANGTQFHCFPANDSGTPRPSVQPFSVDSGPSQTAGSVQMVTGTYSDMSTSYMPFSVVWDSTASKLVALWMSASSSYIYGSIGTITGSGSTATVSWTAPIFVWGISIDFAYAIDTAASTGGIAAFFRNTSTGQGYTLNMIMNGTATGWSTVNSASLGNNIPPPNTGSAGQDDVRVSHMAAFNTTTASSGSGTCLYEYWDSASNIFYSSTVTLSGGATGTWTFSSFYNNTTWAGANLTPSGLNNMYDPVSERFITHFVTGNSDNAYREVVTLKYADQSTITHHDQIYYSASDTVGSLYAVTSLYGSGGYYNARPPITRNSLGDVLILWDSGGVYRCTLLTVTGTTIDRAGLAGSTSTIPTSWGYSSYWTPVIPRYVTGNTFLAASVYYGSTTYYTAVPTQIATTPANEYLGFSRTAVTGAGLPIEVNVVGAIDENQTGLTAGQDYYVQNDGTLGTGVIANRDIGRALSATKMLVTGTGSGTV